MFLDHTPPTSLKGIVRGPDGHVDARRHGASRRHLRRSRRLTAGILIGLAATVVLIVYLGVMLSR